MPISVNNAQNLCCQKYFVEEGHVLLNVQTHWSKSRCFQKTWSLEMNGQDYGIIKYQQANVHLFLLTPSKCSSHGLLPLTNILEEHLIFLKCEVSRGQIWFSGHPTSWRCPIDVPDVSWTSIWRLVSTGERHDMKRV